LGGAEEHNDITGGGDHGAPYPAYDARRHRPTLDEGRAIRNGFVSCGPQPGIEIARSLGDLRHSVYTPALGAEGGLAAGGSA
jgi:hypothetical protein